MITGFRGIETDRLLLREWQNEDRALFAEMNADPRVREFFPNLLTQAESDASVARFREHQARHGFCFFAAELRGPQIFVGFIGLQEMSFAVSGIEQPAVEIGWRLRASYWGQGLATEGAHAALQYAREICKLRQVVAITAPANLRSRRVMEKIGLTHRPELDFNNPRMPEGHPLRTHVLYSAMLA